MMRPALKRLRRPRRAGPYDALYEAEGLLWPDRPGRMVRRACELAQPGRALDLGCGDGKNLVFLERSGWHVDALDVSWRACEGARRRLERADLRQRGWLECDDVVYGGWSHGTYNLVVAYGLLHCLVAEEASVVVRAVYDALLPGGLFAFAVFNDLLPVPPGHGTTELFLRPPRYIFEVASDFEPVDLSFGAIEEHHGRTVGLHRHALTWGLLRKPTP
jgi:SAM-dependent methyltransferase